MEHIGICSYYYYSSSDNNNSNNCGLGSRHRWAALSTTAACDTNIEFFFFHVIIVVFIEYQQYSVDAVGSGRGISFSRDWQQQQQQQ